MNFLKVEMAWASSNLGSNPHVNGGYKAGEPRGLQHHYPLDSGVSKRDSGWAPDHNVPRPRPPSLSRELLRSRP
ncbi:uncharacterized protein J3R85_015166 [Psidium guajava]|nr:uncharacterized protein J3R85_015166 [Psidium guajava]